MESLRGFPFGGFPWNLAAYAWVDMPGALLLSAWVGAFGVSWLLLFANTSLALAWRERCWELAVAGVLLTALVLTWAARFSHDEEERSGELLRRRGSAGEVRLIQPDSPIVQPEESSSNYQRLIQMSLEACDGTAGRLVVWPESAAFPHHYKGSARLQYDVARLHAAGCQVLLGTVTFEEDRYFNSALLVNGGAVVGHYSKRRLVPWGEYIPLKDVFPFVGKLARNVGEFTPGAGPGLLPWNGEKIGMAICYEVVFSGAIAEQVRAGATLLVTITNDAWYGDTAAPWQHFRAARFRAAENRRPLLRAALTGVSALVDAQGQVVERLGVAERGVISGRVLGRQGLTPFSRAPRLAIVLSIGLAVFAIVRARRRLSS
jgi:apolipoprotein N-acyltransferase